MSEEKPKVDVNVVQVVASALAAVSSAVLLSTVGVAGTVIGAAVGSVIATVGSAVYSYSLQASRDRVAAAAQLAASARVRRTGQDRPGQQTTREHLQQPPEASTRATQHATEAAEEAARPQWREALNNLPWKRVALVTVGVFVAAMVAIVAFELIAGEPVSKITHGTSGDRTGTSIPGLGGSSKKTPSPTPTPSETASPTESPSETPSTATDSPSESATASPTQSPSDSSSATPTPDPGATGSPVESPSVSPSAAATGTPAG
jgi:hypothetical protein